jgi:hypothetical protein
LLGSVNSKLAEMQALRNWALSLPIGLKHKLAGN